MNLKLLQGALKYGLKGKPITGVWSVFSATRKGLTFEGSSLPWNSCEELYQKIKGL